MLIQAANAQSVNLRASMPRLPLFPSDPPSCRVSSRQLRVLTCSVPLAATSAPRIPTRALRPETRSILYSVKLMLSHSSRMGDLGPSLHVVNLFYSTVASTVCHFMLCTGPPVQLALVIVDMASA